MEKLNAILVTGAAGFIGSNLVKRLVADGRQVCVLVKPSTNLARIQELLPKITCCRADLLDFDGLKRELEEIRPQGVFHLAASNIQSGVTAEDSEVAETNILGTRNLLQALGGINYDFFINLGSFLEYGPKSGPIKESELCAPPELYSITKLAATLYGQAVARRDNKPIITFRLFTPYGPAVQPGRLIYEVITRALRNEEISLTQPKVARDFIFVEDLIELLLEAKDKAKNYQGEIFNAGSGQAITLESVVNEVLKITGSKSRINWGAFKSVAYDNEFWQADLSKTCANFAWRPTHTLSSGLIETIDWFKKFAK
ncbi:MAG: hypothetical protein A2921_04115 [Candidatus Magasanikbacteria bacterium RIFCSPLOWO2_01_FULL_43_20b]|uniref:NAD-dependent epimerase/dehydratase domain-containing protein n=1 Tax=Candidatus Magasanikbacteria bacterium RIFCSPLOWO2_12_FULL_43_12 TaxID=1798692 RepID=A0A1F6MVK3_9BACT|nr:MAG: hypothetical protein A3C74_03045 [Candidatus Magasanikbacteria bacterium RIFCSPHIGHO2_02_FULL_44_13]OGH72765.1 MAG: hypothetical protein A3I93_00805 [Candidatus Magasanikbacteria bacterium RIFCSPLOWO2_02_FULL_43_22]OGH73258.1 MAG: hypothetical protein A2921_04115 [Candidatus Magasanikbacteria bacterium RIFCSPLOWO2_01_FULL_43_20b]OGH75520.1 MAG: hypothetical protein A3G00_00455 [Candidatus Magasanikbacteria bacterium RIFCSPLOWO2_12_FULL_43_12]